MNGPTHVNSCRLYRIHVVLVHIRFALFLFGYSIPPLVYTRSRKLCEVGRGICVFVHLWNHRNEESNLTGQEDPESHGTTASSVLPAHHCLVLPSSPPLPSPPLRHLAPPPPLGVGADTPLSRPPLAVASSQPYEIISSDMDTSVLTLTAMVCI